MKSTRIRICASIVGLILLGCSNVNGSDAPPLKAKEQAEIGAKCVYWANGCVPVLTRLLAFPEQYEGMTIRYDGYVTIAQKESIFPSYISACNGLPGLSFELIGLIKDDELIERITRLGVARARLTGRVHVPLGSSRTRLGQIFVDRVHMQSEDMDVLVLTNTAGMFRPVKKAACHDDFPSNDQ